MKGYIPGGRWKALRGRGLAMEVVSPSLPEESSVFSIQGVWHRASLVPRPPLAALFTAEEKQKQKKPWLLEKLPGEAWV